jgi:hypothetical protein
VQGGSTVVNGGDATGFAETRTSNTVMTTSLIAATVNVKFGTLVQSIGAGGTVTLGTSSCSGGGLIWKSVTPSGVLEIDSNTNVNLANVTVSGFVKNSNTATGTPNGNFPLYRLSCGNSGADQWDSNMILDLRATYAQKNVTGGTFVIPTEGATGTTSLDIDPVRLQGSDPKLLTAGTVSGTGAALCTDANGGATTVACAGGGATMVAEDIPFIPSTQSPGMASAFLNNVSTNSWLDMGVLTFANGVTQHATLSVNLPASWTGAVDLRFSWSNLTGGSGNVKFDIQTWCIANSGGSVAAANYNAAQSTTVAVPAANTLQELVQTGLTLTGCAASSRMNILITRDITVGSNYAGNVYYFNGTVTVRHTLP